MNFTIKAQENTQCYDTNLSRSVDIIIQMLEKYIDNIDFKKYNKLEFIKFTKDFISNIPFDIQILSDRYRLKKIPKNEIYIIIHNRFNHSCYIIINLLDIFRRKKISELLN